MVAVERTQVETSCSATANRLSCARILVKNAAGKLRDCKELMRRGAPVDDVLAEAERVMEDALVEVRLMRDCREGGR